MRADWVVELVETLGQNSRREAFDVSAGINLVNLNPRERKKKKTERKRTDLSSASSSGPVDTGLRKAARSRDLLTALHSAVETMVLPTSVLAP